MSSIGGIGSWASQQAYSPYTPPTFSQLDTDSNGGLSLDEFEAGAPKGQSGSGASSAAPQAGAEALFNKIDTDGNGSISSDELSAFQTQISNARQSQAFTTQLLASGQSGSDATQPASGSATGQSGAVHHGGHHHGGGGGGLGGGLAAVLEGDTSSDSSSTDDSSTDQDALSTLEGILGNTPTDSTDGTTNPLDLLTANNAYASNSSSSDMWSSVSNLLQDAA